MPDESCRRCGGELYSCSLCSECKKTIQQICRVCGSKTEERFHDKCLTVKAYPTGNGIMTEIIMLPNPAIRTKKFHPIRNILLAFGIVGFFVLGFAIATNLDSVQELTSEEEPTKSTTVTQELPGQPPVQIRMEYENCLGSGTGQYITLRCPTEIGKVYEAALVMPSDLAAKFTDDVFYIRGISVSENSDGSVYLRYQDNLYRAFFFGCSLFSSSCK